MKWDQTEKKQLLLYCAIAYGVTFFMGLFMWYGQKNSMDVSAFPNAQMMYPAAGVMLAYLATRWSDKKLPKAFYFVYMVLTAALIVLAVLSAAMPDEVIVIGGAVSLWAYLQQILFMAGSIVSWILILASGRERRKAYGLNGAKWKQSVLMILLFLGLYFLRTFIAYALGGEPGTFLEIMSGSTAWIYIAALPLNFFLVMAPFFGEEYGWRYFLQPLLQKRFGLRGGVIVLGIVWGLWHLPVNFFYYSPGTGLQSAVGQQITCITLGIFFAYAYMKTKNIWVPVALHYLNNNLVPVIAGDYSADVLSGNTTTWASLLPALALNGLLFGMFLCSKVFSEKKNAGEESETA